MLNKEKREEMAKKKIEISRSEYNDTVTTMLAELACEALSHNDHEAVVVIQEYGLFFAEIIGDTLFDEKLTQLRKYVKESEENQNG